MSPISIGDSPTPKRHFQSRGLGPATLLNRQRILSQHQLNMKRSHQSRFRAYLPSSGWHTDKFLTNNDHIHRLNIRRTSWLLWWASPRIMSDTVKPQNPQRTTVRLPHRWLFLLMQTIQPEGMWCDRQVNQKHVECDENSSDLHWTERRTNNDHIRRLNIRHTYWHNVGLTDLDIVKDYVQWV